MHSAKRADTYTAAWGQISPAGHTQRRGIVTLVGTEHLRRALPPKGVIAAGHLITHSVAYPVTHAQAKPSQGNLWWLALKPLPTK